MDLTPLTQDVHRIRVTPGIQRRQDAAAGPRGLSTTLDPLHQRDRDAGHRELARYQHADEPAAHRYHIAHIQNPYVQLTGCRGKSTGHRPPPDRENPRVT